MLAFQISARKAGRPASSTPHARRIFKAAGAALVPSEAMIKLLAATRRPSSQRRLHASKHCPGDAGNGHRTAAGDTGGNARVGVSGLSDAAPQRRRRRVRAEQDRRRADEGVPGGPRNAGRGIRERSRDGRRPDRIGRARPAAFTSGRRHVPHRGRAGSGRARPDARRPP